jgi:hypothetical protein
MPKGKEFFGPFSSGGDSPIPLSFAKPSLRGGIEPGNPETRGPGEKFPWSSACLVSLSILLRVFPQSRCRVEFRFRSRTGHCLMHGIRAKVNAAGPCHAAEIGIGGDSVEDNALESCAASQAKSWRIFDFIPTTSPATGLPMRRPPPACSNPCRARIHSRAGR